MKYTKFTFMLFGMLLSCFTLADAAKAEGSRSYITPSGSDNRQCTRSQPCRTFDGALAKTDAGGEIIALETGTYDPATITKSITLTAAPGADVVIRATSGNAVTLNLNQGQKVVLRGLKLSGPGQDSNVIGVLLGQVTNGSVFIEHCVISGFGTGIRAHTVDSAARLGIIDTVIRDNHTGLTTDFSGTDRNGAFATRTRFERNHIGVSNTGLLPFVAKECVASDNGVGFVADGQGRLVITGLLATRNGTGVEATGDGRIFIGSSTISGNLHGLSSLTVVRTMGNNMIIENEIDFSAPAFVVLAGI